MLAHCQFVLGPEVAELEAKLAGVLRRGALRRRVSSGTDALQIALMAEGIGRGDAVFLPAFTYTATAEVPLLLGATPVFVDVDPRTFQIDPAHLAARMAEVRRAGRLRPRAVIGVDLFGQPADWPALRAIAGGGGLVHAGRLRAEFRRVAARRAAGPRGGCDRHQLLPLQAARRLWRRRRAVHRERRARGAVPQSLRTHGEGTTRYEVLRTGMNGRLDTLQAAVLLSKLTVFEDELAARARIAAVYDARLANAVTVPARVAGQRQRLGDLCRPAARCGGARADAGRAARGGRADGDLLSPAAASAARVSGRA